MIWLGPPCSKNDEKTRWRCDKGHIFNKSYAKLKRSGRCPECNDVVNGVIVSRQQRQISEMVGGELNFPEGRLRIDVALVDSRIAIEYDCWYWHKGKLEKDWQRVKTLTRKGWKVLAIKSRANIPSQEELYKSIACLVNGSRYEEIILQDWGE